MLVSAEPSAWHSAETDVAFQPRRLVLVDWTWSFVRLQSRLQQRSIQWTALPEVSLRYRMGHWRSFVGITATYCERVCDSVSDKQKQTGVVQHVPVAGACYIISGVHREGVWGKGSRPPNT